MPIDPLRWWYPEQKTAGIIPAILPWLLSPASVLYGAIADYRMKRHPGYTSSLPVICVGNFTAGGTGKTPLAMEIATRLQAQGHRPTFLTRGYGGTVVGPYEVDVNRDIAARTGDEPLLLARTAPTVIARDRAQGARHIERTNADIIIMDDGMQNPSLAKTMTIAVVDGARGIGNGWTIPSGPLRAPFQAQSQMVDVIVLNGQCSQSTVTSPVSKNFGGTVLNGHIKPATTAANLAGTPVIAISGIGNPERFCQTLADSGATVVTRHSYPDHHAFTDTEATEILAAAERMDTMIVMTEKDQVRLADAKNKTPRANLLNRSYALPVVFALQESCSGRLDALLNMVTRKRQPREPGMFDRAPAR